MQPITMLVEKEGKQFVSRCPELGVASCGDTETAALIAICEAVGLYLEMCVDLSKDAFDKEA